MALRFPNQAAGQNPNPQIPPPAGQPSGSPKRKRVTQRLVLGSKSGLVDSNESHTGRIRLPGATEPKAEVVVHEEVQGDVYLPAYELLQCIPAEFLTADHETLFASEQAQAEVPVPLKLILPGLPSGRIEIPIAELSTHMPEGMVQSAAELGDYATSPIKLPLQSIIPRIPPEFLVLRYDQKPIDDSVAKLEDPFSMEMLQAAAREKMEAEASGGDPDPASVDEEAVDRENFSAGYDQETASAEEQQFHSQSIDAEMDPTVPMIDDDGEDSPPSWPSPESESLTDGPDEPDTTLPEEPIDQSASGEEPDLSFTKTEAFRQFLEENVEENAPEESSAVEPELAVTEMIEQNEVPDFPEGRAASPAFEDQETIAIGEPSIAVSGVTPPEAAPPFPPVKPAPKPGNQENDTPPKFHFKVPAPGASAEKKPVAKPEFKMPTLRKPQPASVEPAYDISRDTTISKTSKMSSPAAQAVVQISDGLRHALRLDTSKEVTLRDIVHQVNCWPGMEGCILGGKDGLTITSEIEDERFGNSLSAFAPKILSRLNELFQDLGFEQVQEMQTPMDTGSVFIFRYEALFFIALCAEPTLPASYRQLIKEMITELAKQKNV